MFYEQKWFYGVLMCRYNPTGEWEPVSDKEINAQCEIKCLEVKGLKAQLAETEAKLAETEAKLAETEAKLAETLEGAAKMVGKKPLPELMMASYHEAIGWNACLESIYGGDL